MDLILSEERDADRYSDAIRSMQEERPICGYYKERNEEMKEKLMACKTKKKGKGKKGY